MSNEVDKYFLEHVGESSSFIANTSSGKFETERTWFVVHFDVRFDVLFDVRFDVRKERSIGIVIRSLENGAIAKRRNFYERSCGRGPFAICVNDKKM